MKDTEILVKLNQSIVAAKSSLDAVEKWTQTLAKKNGVDSNAVFEKAKTIDVTNFSTEEEQIVEGIFDGENMVDAEGSQYPVPTNYASKSKLIEGDGLKLTIKPNGAFIFKQIELVGRKLTTGHLIMDEGQYKVLCDDKTYNVLYASVTFFRANVGDKVTVIIPEKGSPSWSAIENVIPAEATKNVA